MRSSNVFLTSFRNGLFPEIKLSASSLPAPDMFTRHANSLCCCRKASPPAGSSRMLSLRRSIQLTWSKLHARHVFARHAVLAALSRPRFAAITLATKSCKDSHPRVVHSCFPGRQCKHVTFSRAARFSQHCRHPAPPPPDSQRKTIKNDTLVSFTRAFWTDVASR